MYTNTARVDVVVYDYLTFQEEDTYQRGDKTIKITKDGLESFYKDQIISLKVEQNGLSKSLLTYGSTLLKDLDDVIIDIISAELDIRKHTSDIEEMFGGINEIMSNSFNIDQYTGYVIGEVMKLTSGTIAHYLGSAFLLNHCLSLSDLQDRIIPNSFVHKQMRLKMTHNLDITHSDIQSTFFTNDMILTSIIVKHLYSRSVSKI